MLDQATADDRWDVFWLTVYTITFTSHLVTSSALDFVRNFCVYRVAHKNVPNFAMMFYGSTVEFKQKEMAVLKSNYRWTTSEIMTLYAFVLTVKYTI